MIRLLGGAVPSLDERASHLLQYSFGPYGINDLPLIQGKQNVKQPDRRKHIGIK
jgi:hypothetical protein